MPTPESETTSVTACAFRASRTSMLPPAGVNFTALDTRFHATWASRSASPRTTASAGKLTVSTSRLASIAGADDSSTLRTTRAKSTSVTWSSILPVMAWVTSSRSPMSCRWVSALRSMTSTARRAVSASTRPLLNILAQPTMAVSGVDVLEGDRLLVQHHPAGDAGVHRDAAALPERGDGALVGEVALVAVAQDESDAVGAAHLARDPRELAGDLEQRVGRRDAHRP